MVDFYKFFNKIPGGALLIPMLLAAILNTLFPNLFTTLGGTSLAMFRNGSLAIVGIIMFGLGASTNLKVIGKVLKRNGTLALARLAIALSSGILYVKLFGMGGVLGISAVAFATCICSNNPGVYIGLMQDYGDQVDMGNVPIMTIICIPLFPLLILAAGGASLDIMSVITALVPYILGLVMGNLDPKMAKMWQPMSNIMLPLLGFNFGCAINLLTALKAGVGGIVLGLVYMVLSVPVLVFADRFFNKRPGYAGSATCSVAGIAMAIPSMMGEAFAGYLPTALPQIAMCLIVTCTLNPIITKAVVKKWGAPCELSGK